MEYAHSSESPLDTVDSTVGERTTEAFKQLGNDTRLAILLALWEVKDPGPTPPDASDPVVSFSDLRDRVGIRQGAQFTYHLDKLADTFVRQTEDGYTLTTSAEQILRAVFAGTLTDHSPVDGAPIDTECFRCGGPVVIDYRDGIYRKRCTSCEGSFQDPDAPPGVISRSYIPPAGLANRTPQEFEREGSRWKRHRWQSMMEGVCPDCAGTVTTTIDVCEAHETHDGTLCEYCGTIHEIWVCYVCDVCKFLYGIPVEWVAVYNELAVLAFFHERGLDPNALYDGSAMEDVYDAIAQVEVSSEEPLEIGVTVELDGDRLDVTLDDEARVIDVTEAPS